MRRSCLGSNQQVVNELSKSSYKNAVTSLLNSEPDLSDPPETEEMSEIIDWWIIKMEKPSGGLHEKMAWFWHSLLTTHRNDANGPYFVGKQLGLLRTQALGNYRDLLQEFVVDGALLAYLDGDGSQASNPNENLSRELMELFTLGVGQYSEDDVRAAARAMAGWQVDRETNKVNFNKRRAFIAPLLFRGVQDSWDTKKIVDHLCDDKRTAAYVGRQVWFYLGGGWLNDSDSEKLGDWWHGENLEIKPLVEKALRDTEGSPDYQRPKTGLEYFYSHSAIVNYKISDNLYRLRDLNQMPYEPPNVAGWPKDDRWLDTGSMLVRGQMAFNVDFEQIDDWQSIDANEAFNRCGLYAISNKTQKAMNLVEKADMDSDDKARASLHVALSSPEFQML